MASLASIAPCQRLTPVLATLQNSFTNIPGHAVPVVAHGGRWQRRPVLSIHGGSGRAIANSGAHGASASVPGDAGGGGIGVAEFYTGKNILIVGGTGFVAKVLMEKILRTNPDVGKIYVMVKAKDTQAALKRLQKEVVDTDLFKCLQQIHGKDYQNFVASKLIPVVGNVRECSVGIATELAKEITDEVDIIVNMAANTTFDERYDVAIDTNTLGPLRMISFAHRFKKLKLFLHLSTAYVNGQRRGVVLEEPLYLGETIASRVGSSSDLPEHNNIVLDIEAEIKLAFDSRRQFNNSALFHKEMKDLGLHRAKLHGWHDTYVFTKAMGEMVINTMRGEIPVVTIRPSIIESTLKDPFPGWIQGNRVMDPNILYYGKGQMSCFLADPECVYDVVPVDVVVNAMMAAMAKHGGGMAMVPGNCLYHLTSSSMNPLVAREMGRYIYQHFSQSPLIDKAGRPIIVQPPSSIGNMEEFIRYVQSNVVLPEGNREDMLSPQRERSRLRTKAIAEQIIHMSRIYEPYTFYGGRFDSANTEALFAEISEQERAIFHFDMRSIDWMDYITNVHIPGLRKHVLKEEQHVVNPPVSDEASLL